MGVNAAREAHICTAESIAAFLRHEQAAGASADCLRQRKTNIRALYDWLAPEKRITYDGLRQWRQSLLAAGLTAEEVRAILSHGYIHLNDVEPLTDMEKSLFTVDELTGIIQAAARMRPLGITDMEVSSFMKKFKDKKFAAKCDREVIKKGCEMLGMEVKEVASIVIEAMKAHAAELQIGPKE